MVDSSAVNTLLESIKDFSDWEEEIMSMVLRAGRELTQEFFPALDEHLAKARDKKRFKIVGFRPRTLVTRFGEVTFMRRLYRDEDGRGRFLLDEALGIEKRAAASSSVRELAVTLSAHVPFRVASSLLSRLLPSGISHQAIHSLVARLARFRNRLPA